MKEYKMRRGEYLEERIPDMESTVVDYFGPITETQEFKGSDLFVIGEPDNPVFEKIVVGTVEYSGKKDKLAVEFHERDPTELGPDELEAAGEAVDAKNDFLLEATGRDAKARRDSLKRSVEDDPDHDF
ncbi:uncharacterized protein Nmag_1504 [Natrialba magadii ATCC 43099]|uniref:DUF5611 domain-containing protein n=1 Tax=Natrialba magadii (strain ATCC 43099 / DSM 3394 / CCM 3739 / CIP 104546 / IAM 13178 / JCM 8861 / NBRC 102185 / NCIMB 2190 / MS3) TaxID=547559 RepID=D3STR3_NATMM|nr:DUF5611 family protein [Natrialba magadii]ADD05080.1 uncharacterized protein Nmag_1504 [Natrialba magadii ATCC 43099]ELY23315.1 hypothetical protein C500_20046 [Natrialba magadii ATCC 43099]